MSNINTFSELYSVCENSNKKIYEAAIEYEVLLGEYAKEQILSQAKKSLAAMKTAIKEGLVSSELSPSSMSGDDCEKLQKRFKKETSLLGNYAQKVMLYALATVEQNIRMGTIVACPTAGSCGIVPSVLIAYAQDYKISEEEQINALITAGEVGRLVSNKLALAGAVGGCQAECGVASAMAAAALTQMRGGNIKQILNSVALALKNILGLTCDPVCGLVEVPCVKRNPFLAVSAISASELAMADIVSKIPVDEVVDAMEQTGKLMSPLLKESSQGGLAKTKTAIELEKRILNNIK